MSFIPCAGIHLSGPNAGKSAVVVLRLRHSAESPDNPGHLSGFELVRVYEKIGTFGNLFSDDRLAGILSRESPLARVFIDCPLTQPPCVECSVSACPGVVHCADVGVAWMLAVATRAGASRKVRRRKVNPQGQRLWDVYQGAVSPNSFREPTYTSNVAPLVTRARTLQRRLNANPDPRIILHETSVPIAVEILAEKFKIIPPPGMPAGAAYRNFEHGRDYRRTLVEALLNSYVLSPSVSSVESGWEAVHRSVEVFQAFVTALVACMHDQGNTTLPVEGFTEAGGGWVHLPVFG